MSVDNINEKKSDGAEESSEEVVKPYTSGFVGLVGLPNAGKSCFLNSLLKEKVSIVSRKPQATRKRVHGIVTRETSQLIFVDSPGFLHESKTSLTKYIAEEAQEVIQDVDCLLLLVPCNQVPGEDFYKLLKLLEEQDKPWAICVTKLDQKPHPEFFVFYDKMKKSEYTVFENSSVDPKPDSVEEIYSFLERNLPETSGALYDSELFTTETLRELVAEFIREPCFELLEHEIPFGMAVRILQFKEEEELTRIEASLVVEKENHKPIVIGKKASMLKQIGQAAREKIEELLQTKVYLGLRVIHREAWSQKKSFMEEFGYEHKS